MKQTDRSILNIHIGCVLLFLLMLAVGTAPANAKPRKLSAEDLTRIIQEVDPSVYYGGLLVSTGETITGPVLIIAGALDLQDSGVVSGEVWIVDGQLVITGAGRVDGDVHLVNSRPYRSRESVVTGEITRYRCSCAFDPEQFEQNDTVLFVKVKDPLALKIRPTFGMGDGNRVDYDLWWVGFDRKNDKLKKPYTRIDAKLLIPWKNNNRGLLGFDLDIAMPVRGHEADLLIRGFKKTTTNDDWQLSLSENGWITWLAANDYPDYYERQGGALGLAWRPWRHWEFTGLTSFQRDVSLITRHTESILYPNRPFRDNPPIDQGERLAATGTAVYDTRYDEYFPANACRGELWLEKGIADGPGDFSYLAFMLDLRRCNELKRWLHWDFRGRLFSSFDQIPEQVTQSLNGYGGVRGLDDIPFSVRRGDRLALLSSEVRLALPELPVFKWIFGRWELVTFGDLGLLDRADNPEAPLGFLNTEFDTWGKSVGIGIAGETFIPYLGVYIAQDLDRDRKRPRVIVRAMRSF